MMAFWQTSLSETVTNSGKLIASELHRNDLADWLTNYNESAPTSSNQGTSNLAFQRWFRFKEAFSPKFVADTLSSLPYKVETCLDPFLGSGTTAITCRMLGINSIGTEVNPFLADLVESKLTPIDTSIFLEDYENLISDLIYLPEDDILTEGMPLSFNEPGIKERYVFNSEVYKTIRALLRSSKKLAHPHHRLIKVLLGSILIENSNVIVNGKGRRYRKNWEKRVLGKNDVIKSLDCAVDRAIYDINKYIGLPKGDHHILRGDTRALLPTIQKADAIIFSPPYPNSFDYTDVYNVELWMLDYLQSGSDNKKLRSLTLRSHVQAKWSKNGNTANSILLNDTINELNQNIEVLWNKNIPQMISCYFDDLHCIFREFQRILDRGHHAIIAVGDSQYAGVHIDVGRILEEMVSSLGFKLVEKGSIRSMRSSSQHGGKLDLSEHCLVFEKK